ncbi:hypothetical protein [Rhodococcus marinonascens]|uniref:hypothetical protein n=1 Tax=Rhodococcus marinonascens TaxID=38311 RepID=UPI000933E72F|nr:hypothetical protein [Rhodococcus marinonascens]
MPADPAAADAHPRRAQVMANKGGREHENTRAASSEARASDKSLLTRLELAHQRIRTLSDESGALREQLARTLGELRTARLGVVVSSDSHTQVQ